MRLRTGPVLCLLASLWASSFADAGRPASQALPADRPAGLAVFESRLLELTNGERQARGLPPLRVSAELVAAARGHSLDMAAHNVLSHLSSNGGSPEDRLVAADAYFSAEGENVARSSLPLAEAVNKSLMDSPDHRQNILNEGYDSIGIGAEESAEGVLFVTEDFSTRLVVLSHDEATRQAASVVQGIRRKRGVEALFWDGKADLLAQGMTESKALGRGLGDIPASFGEVHALWVESALIQDLGKYADEIGLARYQKAGLGITFRRTRENPGGEYIMVLVLLPGDSGPHALRHRN